MGEPISHRRTRSDNVSGGLDSRHTTQPLLDVVDVLRSLVNGESFREVETISQKMTSLQQEVALREDEVIKLNNTVQNVLSSHHEALSKVEKEQESTRQDLKVAHCDSERKQDEITKLKKANGELEVQTMRLAQAQKDLEGLLLQIKEKEDKIQLDKIKLDRQEQVISSQRAKLNDAAKKSENLNKDLEKVKSDLRTIQDFAPSPVADEVEQVYESYPYGFETNVLASRAQFASLWKRCFNVVKTSFEADLTERVLQTPSVWRDLRSYHQVTHQVPLVPLNSATAKNARTVILLAIISEAMVREIFTTTHLVDGDEELRNVLYEMAFKDPPKEVFLRNLLASLKDSTDQEAHVRNVVKHIHGLVREMLEPEVAAKLQSELSAVSNDAARLWRNIQLRKSRFEVDLRTQGESSWKWKSICQQGTSPGLTERDITAGDFATNEVELVVLPRVYIVDHQNDILVVPGRVFQRSETKAAKREASEIATATTVARSSIVEASRPRRATTDQNLPNQAQNNAGPFLGSNSGLSDSQRTQ